MGWASCRGMGSGGTEDWKEEREGVLSPKTNTFQTQTTSYFKYKTTSSGSNEYFTAARQKKKRFNKWTFSPIRQPF